MEFVWLGHDGFRVKAPGLTLYFDPYEIGGGEPADLILVS
ncbi:MAG: MBL fold metallo-hydrolase, partial [Candidatus Hecatellales archaeon]